MAGVRPSRLEVPSSTPHDAGWSDGRTADRVDGGAMGGRQWPASSPPASTRSLRAPARRDRRAVFVHGFDLPADPADPLTTMVSARVRDAGVDQAAADRAAVQSRHLVRRLASTGRTTTVPRWRRSRTCWPVTRRCSSPPPTTTASIRSARTVARPAVEFGRRRDRSRRCRRNGWTRSAIADHRRRAASAVCCENATMRTTAVCARSACGHRLAFASPAAPTASRRCRHRRAPVAGVELKGAGNTWECYLSSCSVAATIAGWCWRCASRAARCVSGASTGRSAGWFSDSAHASAAAAGGAERVVGTARQRCTHSMSQVRPGRRRARLRRRGACSAALGPFSPPRRHRRHPPVQRTATYRVAYMLRPSTRSSSTCAGPARSSTSPRRCSEPTACSPASTASRWCLAAMVSRCIVTIGIRRQVSRAVPARSCARSLHRCQWCRASCRRATVITNPTSTSVVPTTSTRAGGGGVRRRACTPAGNTTTGAPGAARAVRSPVGATALGLSGSLRPTDAAGLDATPSTARLRQIGTYDHEARRSFGWMGLKPWHARRCWCLRSPAGRRTSSRPACGHRGWPRCGGIGSVPPSPWLGCSAASIGVPTPASTRAVRAGRCSPRCRTPSDAWRCRCPRGAC